MQEKGLLKQVSRIQGGNDYELKKAFKLRDQLKENPNIFKEHSVFNENAPDFEELDPDLIGSHIQEARRIRNIEANRDALSYPYDSSLLEKYPTNNLELNKKIRDDLDWAAKKEKIIPIRGGPIDESFYLSPSRQDKPSYDTSSYDTYDYEDGDYMADAAYEQAVSKGHKKALKNKWNQIRSLLEKKKSE